VILCEFVMPLAPIGKGRPRVSVNRGTGKRYVRTPKKTAKWESDFRALSARHLPEEPLEGPLQVDILAVLPRPQRLCRKKDQRGLIWAPVTPDADNVRKAVLDAMSRFWLDDKQVVSGTTIKAYSGKQARRGYVYVCVSEPSELELAHYGMRLGKTLEEQR
jgi:Holliday junction resolvase RusA-like endonuclease